MDTYWNQVDEMGPFLTFEHAEPDGKTVMVRCVIWHDGVPTLSVTMTYVPYPPPVLVEGDGYANPNAVVVR